MTTDFGAKQISKLEILDHRFEPFDKKTVDDLQGIVGLVFSDNSQLVMTVINGFRKIPTSFSAGLHRSGRFEAITVEEPCYGPEHSGFWSREGGNVTQQELAKYVYSASELAADWFGKYTHNEIGTDEWSLCYSKVRDIINLASLNLQLLQKGGLRNLAEIRGELQGSLENQLAAWKADHDLYYRIGKKETENLLRKTTKFRTGYFVLNHMIKILSGSYDLRDFEARHYEAMGQSRAYRLFGPDIKKAKEILGKEYHITQVE